jgi:F-type H+-transporting ATPase subunit a
MYLIASVSQGAYSFLDASDESFGGRVLHSIANNTTLFTLAVVVAIVAVVQLSLHKISQKPTKGQNFLEYFYQSVYNVIEGIVGKHMAKSAFPLLAAIFIFILTCNWAALLPTIGTVGWGATDAHGHFHVVESWLRPANADLNTTLGLTLLFMVLWLYWTIREIGVVGFISHLFAPKGGVKGFVKLLLIPIFFAVGIIEVVSIASRGISLPLRLYGNVFAGENLLHEMMSNGMKLGAWVAESIAPEAMMAKATYFMEVIGATLVCVPFYFLEILIGFIQATVFMLLCAVYIQLSTSHDEAH